MPPTQPQGPPRRFADAAALAAWLHAHPAHVTILHDFVPGHPGVVLELQLRRYPAAFALSVDYTSWVLQAYGEVHTRTSYEFTTLAEALAYVERRFDRRPADIPVPGSPVPALDVDDPTEQGDHAEAWRGLCDRLELLMRDEAASGEPAALRRLARLLGDRGRRTEAAEIELRLLPDVLPGEPEERARALEQRAELHLRAGRPGDAIADLQALTLLEPDDAGHPQRIVDCLHRADRHVDTITAATAQIVRLTATPDAELARYRLGEALRIRGEAHYHLGEWSAARGDYEAAIALHPNDADTLSDLAELLLAHGDIDGADLHAQRAWDAQSGASGGFLQLILGDVAAARGRLADAREWWEAAESCGHPRARQRLDDDEGPASERRG